MIEMKMMQNAQSLSEDRYRCAVVSSNYDKEYCPCFQSCSSRFNEVFRQMLLVDNKTRTYYCLLPANRFKS